MPPRILLHSHHDHDHQESEGSATIAKTTAMCVLFTASFIIGNIPIKLNQWLNWSSDAKSNAYVKLLLGLGGGVLLCTTFIHLLPEVSENFEKLDLTPNVEIHYAEVLMCVGFFIMYLVEECVHVYLEYKEKPPDMKIPLKEPVDVDLGLALKRSISIRRGEIPDVKRLRQELAIEAEHNGHSHSHSHHHSHTPVHGGSSTVAIIRGLLVVLALSVHELFEGLAVGLESSPSTVWYMFGAVSAHKLVIAFCIGVELVTSGLKTYLVIIYVFMFAVVSPAGIGIGIMVSETDSSSTTLVSVILQGLASGTLMYVVFFEILQGDKRDGLKQFGAILLGFLIMFGITMIEA
ncbi:unnamed protein product [Diabrotica balteata]|uniref:Uncharacterized protein n=1 Tax=Diabrotica balteata TaxID=107213 RepID=A0A9N9XF86_DIABA|nr:unnamed protein product [Diabrotica balteata]